MLSSVAASRCPAGYRIEMIVPSTGEDGCRCCRMPPTPLWLAADEAKCIAKDALEVGSGRCI